MSYQQLRSYGDMVMAYSLMRQTWGAGDWTRIGEWFISYTILAPVLFWDLCPILQFFNHIRMISSLPVFNEYSAADKVSCSIARTQHSDSASNESRTCKFWILSLTLYQLSYWALPLIMHLGSLHCKQFDRDQIAPFGTVWLGYIFCASGWGWVRN